MSLQTRFTLGISGVVLLLSCGLLGSLYFAERNHLLKESENARRDVAQKLAGVSRESILSKDEIMLFNYMRDLTNSPDILWAMFLDPNGRVLNHSNLSLKNKILEDPASQKALAASSIEQRSSLSQAGLEVLEYAVPVRIAGKRIGTSRLGYDAQRLRARVADALQDSLQRFLAVTFLSFIMGILLAFYVAKTLSRPIRILTKGVEEVGRGKLNTRIRVTGKDEIGLLSSKFNQMAERLSELDKLKDLFIATVSHDLRNPLVAIKMSAETLLSDEASREDQKEVSDIILRSTQRLMTMVNNILDVAKMKAGRMEYNKKPVHPERLVDEIFRLYEIPTKNKGVAMRKSLPKNIPPLEVDEEMILRVFTNIVSNAVKFTREGDRITIGAKLHAQSSEVEFFVSDTGLGISNEHIPQLFQEFSSVSQVAPSIKRHQGAGLGLSIAKVIVQGHGGKIWVQSKPGKGTTFSWTLPYLASLGRGTIHES